MDINRLRQALAIAEQGTFGGAARVLHMSQSSLTRSIQALESEYGIRIFERGRTGARLTAVGARFLNQAERLVRHAESVDRDARQLHLGRDVAVAFGLGPISATLFLPTALEELLELSGSFPIRLKVGSNTELTETLRAGMLDFYVGGVPRETPGAAGARDLRVEAIGGRSGLALLAREGHPLLAQRNDLSSRGRYPIVSGSFAYDTAGGADLESHGFTAPSFVLDDYDLLAALVRRTDALLLASELLLALRPDLGLRDVGVAIAPLTTANYAIVYRRDPPSESAQRVVSVVRRAIGRAAGVTPPRQQSTEPK